MSMKPKYPVVSRRDFFKRGAVVGMDANTLAGQARARARSGQIKFDHVANVVVVGAGASGCRRPYSGKVDATTVAQGLTNAVHTLEIVPNSDGPVPIEAIQVYRPPLK
jgi:hypothetical protein